MPIKFHIAIGAVIAFVMFLAWQLMLVFQQPPPTAEVVSPYKINITSASYGLNCLRMSERDSTSPYADIVAQGKLKKNNVQEQVSALCAEKPSCSFVVGPEVLGDPAPHCSNKELELEYRCFSVDRPWLTKVRNGETAEIDCDKR